MTTHYSCNLRPQRSQKSGFSLIEVLVTLLVLSIGLLGVAALQVVSLQSSSTSLHRSIAVIQANDLVERLWANVCDVADDERRQDIEEKWNDAHADSIPGRSDPSSDPDDPDDPDPVFDAGVYEIGIRWDETRVGGGLQNFVFFTRFPALPECELE